MKALLIVALCGMIGFGASIHAMELTLDEAIDIALNKTPRGEMIRGNLEVAEQNYFARKINFYLPEISINGALPQYTVDESYRFFGGATKKGLRTTRELNYKSFIRLKQSLLTGGDIELTANLVSGDEKYPDLRFDPAANEVVSRGTIVERSRLGDFELTYTQPILKPSESKNNLYNSRDDLSTARLERLEDEAKLEQETVETYVDLLQLGIQSEIIADKFESARLAAGIDSMKLSDGVVSDEDWLISASNRLDAELEFFDIESATSEKRRGLAILMDFDPETGMELVEPAVGGPLSERDKDWMLVSSDKTVQVRKAEIESASAERQANNAASGHGINADLEAKYKTGKGWYDTDGDRQNVDLEGWGIALNFSYPLWDGGASSAAVMSARLGAEQAKLDLSRQRKTAKAEIINLVNKVDVSFKRLEIMKQQIELARNKLDIAQERFDDGQISRITFLESRVFYLEAKDKYLEELKSCLLDRIQLDSKFLEE
jgi:outer membrane protein TolC